MFRKERHTKDSIEAASSCGKRSRKITHDNIYYTAGDTKAELGKNDVDIITDNDVSVIGDSTAHFTAVPTESLTRIAPIRRPSVFEKNVIDKSVNQINKKKAIVDKRHSGRNEKHKVIEQLPPVQLTMHHAPIDSACYIAPQRHKTAGVVTGVFNVATVHSYIAEQAEKRRSTCGFFGCEDDNIYMNSGYCRYHFVHEKCKGD